MTKTDAIYISLLATKLGTSMYFVDLVTSNIIANVLEAFGRASNIFSRILLLVFHNFILSISSFEILAF